MVAFLICLTIAIAIGFLLRRPIQMTMDLSLENRQPRLQFGLHFIGLSGRRTWGLPLKNVDSSSASDPRPDSQSPKFEPEMLGHALWILTRLGRINHQLWERSRIVRFDLQLRVGFGDAARTALWTGHLIEVIAWWMSVRIVPRTTDEPHFVVQPVWDRSELYCNFTSIIELLPSDIILAIAYGLMGRDKGGATSYGESIQHQHA